MTNSCCWLAMILSSGGGHPKTAGLLAFGLAVAVIAHLGLRSRGAYDFVDIMHLWRSSKMAALAWVLSTGPLFIALLFAPTATGRTIILGWLAGLAGIVCVRLAAARASRAFVRLGGLRHNVLIIGTGPEAQRCASLLRADGSGANVVGLQSVDGPSLTDHNEGVGAVQMSELQRSTGKITSEDVWKPKRAMPAETCFVVRGIDARRVDIDEDFPRPGRGVCRVAITQHLRPAMAGQQHRLHRRLLQCFLLFGPPVSTMNVSRFDPVEWSPRAGAVPCQCAAFPRWCMNRGERPFAVKMHGSVLHAMSCRFAA
jgi:hypothetical protein